jgi:hypothetical protein
MIRGMAPPKFRTRVLNACHYTGKKLVSAWLAEDLISRCDHGHRLHDARRLHSSRLIELISEMPARLLEFTTQEAVK